MFKKLVVLSPLHTKGILTLSLFIFAETVTFSNAVSELNELKLKIGNTANTKRKGFTGGAEGASTSDENVPSGANRQGSCPAGPTLPLSRIYPRARLSVRSAVKRYSDDCCLECSNCMDPAQAAKMCHIPRGGHMQTAASVTAAAAAAEGVVEGVAKLPYGIPLHLWKVIFQAILTAINVLCWLIPLKSKKITENKLALSLANAFSGGVFLSLAFGHLIPECVHGFDSNLPEELPYLLVLVGYLVIFFVEKVAFDAHEIMHEMEHAGSAKDSKAAANGDASNVTAGTGGRSAVILLGALAVHSILEMMALGLSDSFGDCALLTLSIALHQPAESIALLVAFLKSGMPKGQILRFLSIFSCMGPIGVALGMAVNEFAAPIVDAVMLAIVAGTFVYVGATEVIPEEWEDSSNKWSKFGALMSGIISILLITQYTMSLAS